jgi:hypothetical protein
VTTDPIDGQRAHDGMLHLGVSYRHHHPPTFSLSGKDDVGVVVHSKIVSSCSFRRSS